MTVELTRVLHVYRTYYPDTQGGLEEVIRQVCWNTYVHGYASRVFTLSVDPQPQVVHRDEAEVHRFPRTFEIASCGVSLSAFRGFRRLVNWSDIVHYHFPWPFGDLLHYFAGVKKPTVVTYHSDIIRQKRLLSVYRPLKTRFLESMDIIVATSPNYFATSDVLSRYAEKVEIIPIGLDNKVHPVVSDEKLISVRARYGEDFFLFVGVLRYYKGLHILLDAIHNTSLRVVIVGSGPVERELKAHADRLGLSNVAFIGQVDDMEKVAMIKLARAIVFPSYLRSEAFGVTLIEGAMYGKPLISTEIGTGTSYVNLHGVTGLVVPPGDAKDLREAMLAMAGDRDMAERMGMEARKRYEQMFTGAVMGERYALLYKRLLANSRKSVDS